MPAPPQLEAGMIGCPEGAEIDLEFRMEAVMEGVLVTGTARAPLTGECARCLEPVSDVAVADFQELFRYPPEGRAEESTADSDAGDVGEEDSEDYYLEGDWIDLEPVVRDAVVLVLPLSPLCREDCPGLCVECGARLADVGPEHGHTDSVDPRWEALRGYDPRSES